MAMRMSLAALGCLLLLAAPAQARVIETKPEPALPLGNPGEWVTTADYPAAALADRIQGTVSFLLTIDTSGRVKICLVTVSSGSDLLDSSACNLITQRARFSIARDPKGRAVEGSYTNRVRWVLPQTASPQPKPIEAEMTFVVETDGRLSDCRVIKAEGAANPDAVRTPCKQGVTTTPFLDASGKPVRRLVRMRNSIAIEPLP